jgi:hypothetical protein
MGLSVRTPLPPVKDVEVPTTPSLPPKPYSRDRTKHSADVTKQRFAIVAPATVKTVAFWDERPCSVERFRRFGDEKRAAYESKGTYRSKGGEETGLRSAQWETVAPKRAGRNIWREESENEGSEARQYGVISEKVVIINR